MQNNDNTKNADATKWEIPIYLRKDVNENTNEKHINLNETKIEKIDKKEKLLYATFKIEKINYKDLYIQNENSNGRFNIKTKPDIDEKILTVNNNFNLHNNKIKIYFDNIKVFRTAIETQPKTTIEYNDYLPFITSRYDISLKNPILIRNDNYKNENKEESNKINELKTNLKIFNKTEKIEDNKKEKEIKIKVYSIISKILNKKKQISFYIKTRIR